MSTTLLLLPALLAAPADDAAPRPEAALAFAARVQPILSNLCARCHASPQHTGAYKLRRVPEGYADRASAQGNLLATARFVRDDRPDLSPLLRMALRPHGGAREAPLPNIHHPAYRTLWAWAAAVWPPPAPAVAAAPAVAEVPAVVTPPEPVPAADPFGPAALRQFLAMPR